MSMKKKKILKLKILKTKEKYKKLVLLYEAVLPK
jgi:hypothetical protein